jgi:hypothetical protein
LKETKANRRTIFGLSGLLIFLALAVSCSKQETASPLPPELHGMELVKETAGQAAETMIARLHGKDVAPTESYVGHYGDGPRHAMLYVSRFESVDQAQSLLRNMSSRIGKGSSGFGHHQQFDVDGTEIHLVLGQGQVHYFYAKERLLFWLGMVPDMARAGLAQLLKVDVDKVPTVESVLSPSLRLPGLSNEGVKKE